MIKKIIKKIILSLCLVLLTNSFAADNLELSLSQFANLVAVQNKINILLSEKIESDNASFFIANQKQNIFLPAFKKMLNIKGYSLFKDGNFYYIDKQKEDNNQTYSYKFKYPMNDELEKYFKLKGIDYYFNDTTNTIFFNAFAKNKNEVIDELKKLDVDYKQVEFKITILYTNLSNLKDRGFNLSAYTQSVSSTDTDNTSSNVYFLNLITMPYTATTNVVDTAKNGLYATIKYLNQNGYTDIKNSPLLTAKSYSKVSFSSVETVPYQTSTTTTSNTTTTTTDSISYKDVGLQINLTPKIFGDDVYFDLDLTVEELLNGSSLTPTTEKKTLNGSYKLKRGQILVLSGVNKESEATTEYGVPLLKDVFLLGEIFKYKSTNKVTNTLTITIEAL